MSNPTPQRTEDLDELEVQELEEASGGTASNGNCPCTLNDGCSSSAEPSLS